MKLFFFFYSGIRNYYAALQVLTNKKIPLSKRGFLPVKVLVGIMITLIMGFFLFLIITRAKNAFAP